MRPHRFDVGRLVPCVMAADAHGPPRPPGNLGNNPLLRIAGLLRQRRLTPAITRGASTAADVGDHGDLRKPAMGPTLRSALKLFLGGRCGEWADPRPVLPPRLTYLR
jgi:hypothetical protein